MSVTVYGIKACDTMKKAFTWLDNNGIAYHFHDYKKEGAPEAALRQWIKALGWEVVINRRGTTWRKLPESLRDSMDAEKAVAAALENPSLIKRPMLETGKLVEAGFKPERYAEIFSR
jgi:arsenate reductase